MEQYRCRGGEERGEYTCKERVDGFFFLTWRTRFSQSGATSSRSSVIVSQECTIETAPELLISQTFTGVKDCPRYFTA